MLVLKKQKSERADCDFQYLPQYWKQLKELQLQTPILTLTKQHRSLYTALADAEMLVQVKALYDEGLSGMEMEFS